MKFKCATCGEEHDDLPHMGSAKPHYWQEPFAEDPTCLLTEDLCIIHGRDYFIRGVIEIPVLDYEEPFGWGVWITQKKENFEIYRDNFDSSEIGPFFGWLSTEIRFYPESCLSLKTMAHFRGCGLRPLIELGECDHPLYLHQQQGITLAQAWEMVHFYTS